MTEHLTIQQVADQFQVTQRTIRYYEELGLIHPQRTSSGRRLFSSKDLTQLGLVFRGKKYGFQLEEINEMIHLFYQDPSGVRQRTEKESSGIFIKTFLPLVIKGIIPIHLLKDTCFHRQNRVFTAR